MDRDNSSISYVTLATCALDQWSMDFEGNYERIVKSIEIAKAKGARYRVGPELEIPGYGCEDHFLEMDTYIHSIEILAKLLESDITKDIICDFGLPILHRSARYNCRCICLDGKIICIRPKMYLAGDGNYREPRYFARWSKAREIEEYSLPPILINATKGQRSVPFGDCAVQTYDAIFSSETCEELFMPQAPNSYLGLAGVEILSNGSGSHHQLRKLNTRLDLIKSATAKNGGVYLYANQLGCDGGRLMFDGCALIAVNGDVVAQGSQFALTDVEVITATVDLDCVRSYRAYSASRGVQAAESPLIPIIKLPWFMSNGSVLITPTPPLKKVFLYTPEEEIAYGPACWLWDYLRRSGASGFFLPLSGGADSSSTATIVASMCKLVAASAKSGDAQVIADARRIAGLDPKDASYLPTDPKEFANRIFHTCFLGTTNSSAATRAFAKGLSHDIGAYHLEFEIDPVVSAIVSLFVATTGKTPKYKVFGGTPNENLALQNIQARLRMLLSYLFAQLLPWVRGKTGYLLVLGSANVDEALRGYYTKYDCSSADINPIGGISKVDLKSFLLWASQPDTFGFTILRGIAEQAPTAELEPITDKYVQTDEVDMGMTYAELSHFGRLRKIAFCGPMSMFKRLTDIWPNLPPREVANKVKFFFEKHAQNRHKMTTLTPSYHAEMYSPDDNRFDHRQFLYNWRWPWQFKQIDLLVERMETEKKSKSLTKL